MYEPKKAECLAASNRGHRASYQYYRWSGLEGTLIESNFPPAWDLNQCPLGYEPRLHQLDH